MLQKATFPSSYFGLVEATPAAKKKWVFFGTACYKFMSRGYMGKCNFDVESDDAD